MATGVLLPETTPPRGAPSCSMRIVLAGATPSRRLRSARYVRIVVAVAAASFSAPSVLGAAVAMSITGASWRACSSIRYGRRASASSDARCSLAVSESACGMSAVTRPSTASCSAGMPARRAIAVASGSDAAASRSVSARRASDRRS